MARASYKQQISYLISRAVPLVTRLTINLALSDEETRFSEAGLRTSENILKAAHVF